MFRTGSGHGDQVPNQENRPAGEGLAEEHPGQVQWLGGGGRRGDSSQLVAWVQSRWAGKAIVEDIARPGGPLLSALTPEPLLVAGAMLGAGDISEPDGQTPALGGLVFQREETEERVIGCVGSLRVSPVGEVV